MNEDNFLEVIEGICKKPKTHTASGSFFEVIMFLEGFALGADVGNNSYHSKFTPFNKWLAQKFAVDEVIVTWVEYRGFFPTDSEAVSMLPTLFKEYLAAKEV
jgi:hypothetical protein